MAYTSSEFQEVRRALLKCNNADRAFLRRWILRWTDDHGHILSDAEPLPDRGIEPEVPALRERKR